METGRGLSPQHTQIKVLTVTGPVGKASLQQGSEDWGATEGLLITP